MIAPRVIIYYNILYINMGSSMRKPSNNKKQKDYALMACVVSMIILIYAVTIIKLSV